MRSIAIPLNYAYSRRGGIQNAFGQSSATIMAYQIVWLYSSCFNPVFNKPIKLWVFLQLLLCSSFFVPAQCDKLRKQIILLVWIYVEEQSPWRAARIGKVARRWKERLRLIESRDCPNLLSRISGASHRLCSYNIWTSFLRGTEVPH